MQLKDYLKLNNYTMRGFAKLVRLSPPTIRHIIEGRDIRLSVAYTILEMTDGAITLDDLIQSKVKNKIQKYIKEDEKKWDDAMKKIG